MCIHIVAFHSIYEVAQSIALFVQIGGVNLFNIAGKYELCTISSTCNYGFNLVRG